MNPHGVTKDFEKALCAYTGAPYAVAVTSCTMALLLAVAWHLRLIPKIGVSNLRRGTEVAVNPRNGRLQWKEEFMTDAEMGIDRRPSIEIPKRTYISVPMSIIHAGGWPTFRDEKWEGWYQLAPLFVWDSARYFSSGMYSTITSYNAGVYPQGGMVCLSFHAQKTLCDTQGGAILHDDPVADEWLRRARFDGRAEGVPPKHDTFTQVGYHCYLSPDVSTRLLWRLGGLPKHNPPLPWGPGTDSDYPDLSEMSIFK